MTRRRVRTGSGPGFIDVDGIVADWPLPHRGENEWDEQVRAVQAGKSHELE